MKTTNHFNFKLSLLFAVFVANLLSMNFLGGKITVFLSVEVSVGIFMAPILFLITDIVEEVYGKKIVRNFFLSTVLAQILIFILTIMVVALPPASRYSFNPEYRIIFSSSLRMMAASIIAFFFGQLHDIWAFAFWKRLTKSRFLWLRNNLSTSVSQLIDTLLFMFIAFYAITPKFTALFILQLSIPYYLFKLIFALLDTPLVYAGVWWLRRKK